jgi:cytochrome c oxidase subunit IV
MEPAPAPGGDGSDPAAPPDGWTPGIPSIREHLPSLVFGAALPIGAYFAVRSHLHTDAQALIVAGAFSVAWILIQFVRQRRVDLVGAIVLSGFAVGVVASTLLGGNSYVLKVRDAFFSALFGVACIVTIYTAKRPALFYVSRYLSAGNDRAKMAAYNQLHEAETGRHTFRVLSVVWGIGLVVEGTSRMVLAEALHTGTFLAVTPFITASIIGALFAFTVAYTKRAQLEAAALTSTLAATPAPDAPSKSDAAAEPPQTADGSPQIPLP